MPKTLANLLTLVVLFLLLAGFLLFWDLGPDHLLKPSSSRTLPSETAEADSYMTRFEITTFAEAGGRDSILRARQALHFVAGNTFVLSEPHLIDYNAGEQMSGWEATADRGLVKSNGGQVILQENVNLWKEMEEGQYDRLLTSELTVFPRKNLASTNKRVKLLSPEGVTTGKGLDADLATEVFSLRSNVKGEYVGL